MNKKYLKVFETEHKKYQAIESELFSAWEMFDNAKSDNFCNSCTLFLKYIDKPFEDRFDNCKQDDSCKEVVRLYDIVRDLKIKEQAVRVEYAKKIFEYFSHLNPKLKSVKDGSKLLWKDAFSDDFNKLTRGDINSLIALLEEDGGRYSF